MSTLTIDSRNAGTRRPGTIVAATVLAGLSALAYIIPWPAYSDTATGIIIASVAIEVLMLAGVFGLFTLRRWGMFVTVAVGSVNAVFSLLGGFDTNVSETMRALNVGAGVLFALIVVLAILPASRRAIR